MNLYDPPEKILREDVENLNLSISQNSPLGRGFTIKEELGSFHSSLQYTYVQTKAIVAASGPDYRIITGRRGSGKSAFINAVKYGSLYAHAIQCDYIEIVNWLKSSTPAPYDDVGVDEYIKECEYFFWILVFRRLAEKKENSKKINEFLNDLGLTKDKNIFHAISKWSEANISSKNISVSISSGILSWLMNKNQTKFIDAKTEAYFLLKKEKCVILIDNPESFNIHSEGSKKIFQALLHASATFQPAAENIVVKFFIPTELYEYLSSNVINWGKINPSIIALRWEPEELLCLMAKRLRFYNFCFVDKEKSSEILKDLEDPDNAYKEWKRYFTDKVRNKAFNVEENSLTYLLRHTQLTPRQCITCTNEVFKLFKQDKSHSEKVMPTHFRHGIDNSETGNARDALNAFEEFYPGSITVCMNSFIHTGGNFKLSDLTSKIISDNENNRDYIENFQKFINLVREAGIIGRAREKFNTPIYNAALYEYEVDGHLRMEMSNSLFIHPMFLKHLSVDRKNSPLKKPTCSKNTLIGEGYFKSLDK